MQKEAPTLHIGCPGKENDAGVYGKCGLKTIVNNIPFAGNTNFTSGPKYTRCCVIIILKLFPHDTALTDETTTIYLPAELVSNALLLNRN